MCPDRGPRPVAHDRLPAFTPAGGRCRLRQDSPAGLANSPYMKPFLKWAGGKYRLVDRIRTHLPAGDRLVEPFAGSAAVFLNTAYPHALLADVNADLIALYRMVQHHGPAFIEAARTLFTPLNNCPERYYAFRDQFNSTADPWTKALLFLYLNRHGYNGLCRYNAAGGFNVPFGRYTRPYFPAAELRAFHERSQGVVFECADFRTVLSGVHTGDVVYCDPPYVPLTATANFSDYAAGGFGARDQEDLARWAADLCARGVPVVISNHDTPITVTLYRHAQVERFGVQRFISCNGRRRQVAAELLAVFAP